MECRGICGTGYRFSLIVLMAVCLAACGGRAPDSGGVPSAAKAASDKAPTAQPTNSSTDPKTAAGSTPAVKPEAAVFEYGYTSVRIENPEAVRYRTEFGFHPDGTIRRAELRELRSGAETRLALVESEPLQGGYKVNYQSFGESPKGYGYTLGWSESGLKVIADGETTGFMFDPTERVFRIPWDKGLETYSPGPDGSIQGELVLSGDRVWFGRYIKIDGTLKFEEIYPDGSVDREMILKPSGPDAWSVSCTGAADSFYEGKLTGLSLFPRGGKYPASAYNLIVITDLWMTEERYPFFALSLLE